MASLYLGRTPFVDDRKQRDLLFSRYLIPAVELPKVPKNIGHEHVYPKQGWGMLGNDTCGCCVFSGAAHEHMLFNKAAGRDVEFDPQGVIEDYASVTGYHPRDPESDKGTSVREAMKYRQQVGIIDTKGRRHKIDAFLRLDHNDPNQMRMALYLFGAVGLGIIVTKRCMTEFQDGVLWTYDKKSKELGGHYVPWIAERKVDKCVSWGRRQGMVPPFMELATEEAWVPVCKEYLDATGKSPEGFDWTTLWADVSAVQAM